MRVCSIFKSLADGRLNQLKKKIICDDESVSTTSSTSSMYKKIVRFGFYGNFYVWTILFPGVWSNRFCYCTVTTKWYKSDFDCHVITVLQQHQCVISANLIKMELLRHWKTSETPGENLLQNLPGRPDERDKNSYNI